MDPKGSPSAPWGLQEHPKDPREDTETPKGTLEHPKDPEETSGTSRAPQGPPEDPRNPEAPRGDPEHPKNPREHPETLKETSGTPGALRGDLKDPETPEGTPEAPGAPRGHPEAAAPPPSPPGVRYRAWVSTGGHWAGGTLARVTLTLVGTLGQSHPCHLQWPQHHLRPGSTVVVEVGSPRALGTPVLLRLRKEPLGSLLPDRWLCASVTVTGPWGDPPGGDPPRGDTPGGDTPRATFNCHRWLDSGCWELPEGTARTPREAAREPLLWEQRQKELRERRETFQQIRVRLRGLCCGGSWKSFEELREALREPGTPISEVVSRRWHEDTFFGVQFLQGVNPVLLRRCPRLPPNFPVTPPMVAPTLGPHSSLDREMEEGRLFLADFGVLEGLPTGTIGGEPQFLAAPLCLLWLSPDGCLRPLAIQLSQHPGPDAPIFVPSDPGWPLAKLWVRGAHFAHHELLSHLLQSHFLGEALAVATLRLPQSHPVHQLLLPHFRFTFHINILARETLLNPGGVIDQATALGREGTLALVARGTAALSYADLCVPDDLEARGVLDVPNYWYRDDALEIWGAIESLAEGIVALYYPEDSDVAEDQELQDWVGEIFTYGVLGNERSGFPSRLCSRPELVKFLTMSIFCCSARHAAVNSGQYDFGAWMPNTPGSLRRAPPRTKEEATPELFLETLPTPAATGALLALLSVVSYEGGEDRPLGSRSQEPFCGSAPRLLFAAFRRRLAEISRRIRNRNEGLELPYPYLDPACVQESIAI